MIRTHNACDAFSVCLAALALVTFCTGVKAADLAPDLKAGQIGQIGQLGRLFFSAAERVELEKKRFAVARPPTATPGDIPPPAAAVTKPAPVAPLPPVPPPAPEYFRINGHVARSNGQTTTWVNGTPHFDEYRGNGESLRLDLKERGGRVDLKVGQTVERYSGERQDSLRGGQIRVHPAR